MAHDLLGRENPIKPQNVTAALRSDSNYVYWDIPSTRPTGTVTGRCVNLRHNESEAEKTWCREPIDDYAHISGWHCLGDNNCPMGDYTVKVKLKNNCGGTEEWSDSIVQERY